jgi:acyl-ACP thioesterase
MTLRSLAAYLQEAADADATRLHVSMTQLVERNLAWVLHRLRIEVDSYPRVGQELAITTWPKRFERLVAHRDFTVCDVSGSQVARASSRWVVVDLTTRSVIRLPDFIRELPVPDRDPALTLESSGPEPVEAPEIERRFEVRRSDLDVAQHVNNTRYIGWAVESVPDEIYQTHRPSAIEIQFRQEAGWSDVVKVQSQSLGGEPVSFAHSLRAEGREKELARATTRWLGS